MQTVVSSQKFPLHNNLQHAVSSGLDSSLMASWVDMSQLLQAKVSHASIEPYLPWWGGFGCILSCGLLCSPSAILFFFPLLKIFFKCMCSNVLDGCRHMHSVHSFSLEASRGLCLMVLELQTLSLIHI